MALLKRRLADFNLRTLEHGFHYLIETFHFVVFTVKYS